MAKFLCITPEQYRKGYFVKIGDIVYQRAYKLIKKEQYYYVVEAPEVAGEKEKAKLKLENIIP